VIGFRVSSRLPASCDAVWSRVATPKGINDELGPWVRMTVPDGAELREGPLGRSWVLLAGVLPVDYDDINLEWAEPGRGFRERSAMASASAWWHDRTLVALPGGGCRVVDHIRFTPRLGALGGLQAFTFEAMFRWRHRRLRRHFGEAR
jgi:ligand-binding SRPBCC domain-containing protein